MKAFSEESRKPVSVFFGGEHVSCECGAAAPQGAGFFWIIHKTAYRTGKCYRVFLRNEKAGFSVSHDFWQGVDVPGDSLSQVIIVKLPFTVPNDPVFTARSDAIKKRGGNSFMELSVPEAVIKFRQGIGRLIRRSDDKGVVVVLDRLIYEKRYGSIFTSSMPECKRLYEPLSELTNKINDFIFD